MKLHEAVAVTYAAMGQELTDAALKIICHDLASYPLAGVLRALTRCRKELRRISLSDIIDRIPGGHLGADEAWALVAPAMNDEGITMVWTEPIKQAFFAALNLGDDMVAARMAFKDAYARLLSEVRESGSPITWQVSLGHSVAGREPALLDAVEKGRLTTEHVRKLLAHSPLPLAEGLQIKRIEGPA